MNRETIKIALNSSLISVLLNGQSSLTKLIPKKILEIVFWKIFDIFDDFSNNSAHNYYRWPMIVHFMCIHF